MSLSEKLITVKRIFQKYGLKGVFKASENEKIILRTILDGKLGYCLYKGIK